MEVVATIKFTFAIYYDTTATARGTTIFLQNVLYTPQQYGYYPGYAGGAVGDFRAHNTLQQLVRYLTAVNLTQVEVTFSNNFLFYL